MRHPPRAPLPAVSLSHVRTRAGLGYAGLAELSLSVARGEIVTLLGGGAGPATALAVLAGFVRAAAGEVCVYGRTLNRTPPHRRRVGMIARPLALFPHVDVADHAGFGPGVTPARATEMLRRLDLVPFARRLPRGLSAEIQFRVALARALAPAPDVLLLENPLVALPQAARAGAKALLRALAAEQGMAMLHATDDSSAALGLSDRIGVMQAGKLLQMDAPRELYESPESLAVAGCLGPINRLPGTKLDQEDDIARIRVAGGVVEAYCVDGLATGESCVVTIRPERIAVAAVPADEMGHGALPARLIETLFEGDHTRMRFVVGHDVVDSAELIVTRPSGLAPPRGTAMSLAWQAHHAHAFRADGA